MAFRRGRIDWYDVIFITLAAAIVYPDKFLEWLSERTGWALGWLHVVLIEVGAIGLMVVAMVWLMPLYPKLEWWYPVLHIGALAMIRIITAILVSLFGFDDG